MKAKRRWLRLAIPMGVVLAVIIGTITVHEIAEPDTGAAHYLSPEKEEPTSGAELAQLLRAKGVTIKRETRSSDALVSAWAKRGEATLFVPTPEFVHPDYLWMMRQSPAGTRVVLVEPGQRQVFEAVPSIGVAATRWATGVAAPGPDCTLTSAGPAAVVRTRYAAEHAHVCYDHGLVSMNFHNVEFVVAGSADPFRSDRLSEHDNAALAVDLLSKKKTLVWLDLHAMEPKPKTYSEDYPGAGTPYPSLQPGHERTRPDASPHPKRSDEAGEFEVGQADGAQPPDPFPPWLLPAFLMLLLTAIAVALARGRRLGAPVSEPLPIDVPGAEAAIGRSRLYRRAKARGAALETLRIEARRRLAAALKIPNDKESILRERPDYEGLLFGPVPENDDELLLMTQRLLKEMPR